MEYLSAPVVGFCVVCVNFDCHIVVLEGALVVTQVRIKIAPIGVCPRKVGILADSLVVVCKRPVVVAHVYVGIGPVVVGVWKVGLKSNGLVVVSYRSA